MGYVRDVFQQRHMEKLVGNYGIGHVRYPTAGGAGKEFAQPMYVNSPYGISLAHNGNLTNSKQLGNELFHAEISKTVWSFHGTILDSYLGLQVLGQSWRVGPLYENS